MGENKLVLDYDYLWQEFSSSGMGIYFLSGRDISILVSAIKFASWATRWVDSDGYLLRSQGRGTDLAAALEYIEQLENRLMTDYTSEIGAGLQAIASAILNRKCCDGTSMAGSAFLQPGVTSGGFPFYGSQVGIEVVENEPPEGFETWEEYELFKCRVANIIADGLILTLRQLRRLSVDGVIAGTVSLGIAFAVGISVPVAGWAVVLAAITVLALVMDKLDDLADELEAVRGEMVCSLYNSSNTTDAYNGVVDLIEEALVAVGASTAITYALRTVALSLVGTDTLNQLFRAGLDILYADADCSGCGQVEFEIVVDVGSTVTSSQNGDTWSFTVDSAGADPVPHSHSFSCTGYDYFTVTTMTYVSGTISGYNGVFGFYVPAGGEPTGWPSEDYGYILTTPRPEVTQFAIYSASTFRQSYVIEGHRPA